jgi:hypothetical protein
MSARGGDARQAQPAQSRGSRPVDHVAVAEEDMLLVIRHDLYIKVVLGPDTCRPGSISLFFSKSKKHFRSISFSIC